MAFFRRVFWFLFLPRAWFKWWKKGMAWPWILLLTGLATGIIAVLTRWIAESNAPPGGP